MEPSIASGANCASHPAERATFICHRCGGFGCERCRALSGTDLCASCHARLGPRVGGQLEVGDLLATSFRIPLSRLSTLLPLCLFQAIPGVILSAYLGLHPLPHLAPGQGPSALLDYAISLAVPLGGLVVLGTLVSTFMLGIYANLFADALSGRSRLLGELAVVGLRRFLPLLGASLVVGMMVGVGSLLCCAPGIYAYACFGLAPTAVALSDAGPIRSLFLANKLVEGHRWIYLAVLAILVCGVAAVSAGFGLMSAVLKLAGPIGVLGGAFVQNYLITAAAIPQAAMNVAVYLRLKPSPAMPAGPSAVGPGPAL